MSRSETRERVIAEARSWLETPFHHAQALKGHGVDCGMLLVRVYVDCALVEDFDPRPYSATYFLHSDRETFREALLARGRQVETPQPADVALFPFGRSYSHGGIVTCVDPLTVIHAVHDYKRVVEEIAESNVNLNGRGAEALFFDLVGGR